MARSWGDANVGRGDEILLTEMEHHSNLVPWRQLAERTGAIVRHVPVTDRGVLEMEAFDRLLSDRTRLVAVTAVSNVLGTINPIGDYRHSAPGRQRVSSSMGAQSVPHLKTDVQAWNVVISSPLAGTR